MYISDQTGQNVTDKIIKTFKNLSVGVYRAEPRGKRMRQKHLPHTDNYKYFFYSRPKFEYEGEYKFLPLIQLENSKSPTFGSPEVLNVYGD